VAPAVPRVELFEQREKALEVLVGRDLSAIVDMVLVHPATGVYEAHASDGVMRFHADGRGGLGVDSVVGRNPLAHQDPTRFSSLDDEHATLFPHRSVNSYPFALEHIAQMFDHPCAPDLCVLHSAAHHYGGHLGQHGSLGVVQARAPFILAGAGVRELGMVDRCCQVIDVAPTILALLDVEPGAGTAGDGTRRDDCHLSRQDGHPLSDLIDASTPPAHAVAVLFDGCNPNVLYDAAASGEAPHVAAMISSGTAFRYGAVASLPTVTLANHASLLTGCHPGHHGVLHNAWYDRSAGRQVVTESAATWHLAMQWLTPGTETVHEALKRARPASVTVSINETADRGADYSTFDLVRRHDARGLFTDTAELPPHTTRSFAESNRQYRWGTWADSLALRQATAIWEGLHLGVGYPPPAFSWVSFSLTDAAFHEGGPHSEMARASVADTDARLGELVATVARAGVLDDTAFVVVADHGMEQNDPAVVGEWGEHLAAAGIPARDEAFGFLYLDV
jgi:predicted AlkP superfamily pyrophosphatase or phosphodiesterase